MKKYRFRGTIAGKPAFLARLDKRRARSLFELGGTVYLVPANFVPFGAWITPLPIEKTGAYSFDEISENFKYYNCINAQTGFFPAYYIDLLSNECFKPVKL